MIYLLIAADKDHWFSPDTDCTTVLNYPEHWRTEYEQVKWVENWVATYNKTIVDNPDWIYCIRTNSNTIFVTLRVLVREGKLSCQQLTIFYVDIHGSRYTLRVNNDGGLDRWPEGFFDTLEKLYGRLL